MLKTTHFALISLGLICCINLCTAQTWGDISLPPNNFTLDFLTVYYQFNPDNTITMAIQCNIPNQYFSLGIGTSMFGSDMWVFEIVSNAVTASDYWSISEIPPTLDTALPGGQNSLQLLGYDITPTYTLVKINRALNTGDPNDLPIQPGPTSFVYATGPAPIMVYHGTARGSGTIDLINTPAPAVVPATGEENVFIIGENEEFVLEEGSLREEEVWITLPDLENLSLL